MVFSSLEFIFIFLPLVLACYTLVPRRFKNALLVFFSLAFYAWGEPIYILIMLFSTVFDYFNGLLIEKYRLFPHKTKLILILSLVGNLGILGFYKYSDFLIQNLNAVFHLGLEPLNLALPIGISFYTFQTLSYAIDVYRGQVKAQKNIIDFAAYVTLFPQLVAGPIVQYKDIEQELSNRSVSLDDFSGGVECFIQGLFKKVFLANNIGLLWQSISALPLGSLSVAQAWLEAIAFTFQIYFDFAGYSDMAIGMGRMFGFHFKENFNFPYCSQSVREFWRRWHISLGQWFKDYVYISLGGSRCSFPCWIFNTCVVWFLTGLWHGASWNFILWGMYFAMWLILEKCFLNKITAHFPKGIRIALTWVIVIIGWMLFSFEDVHQALLYLGQMFALGNTPLYTSEVLYLLSHYGVLLGLCFLFAVGQPIRQFFVRSLNEPKTMWMKPLILIPVFILSLCFLVGETYNPFLYFRF